MPLVFPLLEEDNADSEAWQIMEAHVQECFKESFIAG